MNKELTYINCPGCAYWKYVTLEMRKPCDFCSDTGKILDPKHIVCNNCGDQLSEHPIHPDSYSHEVRSVADSKWLTKRTKYTFRLCEQCVRTMLDSFKIPPSVCDTEGNHEQSYESEVELFLTNKWLKEGGKHQAYLDGKCNERRKCPNSAIYSLFIGGKFTENSLCEQCSKNYFKIKDFELKPFVPNDLRAFL